MSAAVESSPPGFNSLSRSAASAIDRDAVLDRAAGAGALGFDPDLALTEEGVDAHVRRVAWRG